MNNFFSKYHKAQKAFLAILLFLVVSLSFGTFNLQAAQDAEDVQKDIKDIQKQLETEQKNLEESQGDLQNTQSQIYTTANLLEKTEIEMERKEAEIINLEQRIKLNQQILSTYIQQMYYSEKEYPLLAVLEKTRFSEKMANFDQMFNAKRRVLVTILEIEADYEELSGAKKELAEKKEQHEELLSEKQQEKNDIVAEIAETQADISELNAKMNELRSDLSRILGKAYDTGEIKDAIKFANKVTGVRKGFLFGVLTMESGGNPLAGKCTLKNCGMSESREGYFEKICDDLDYSDSKCKKMPLSCSPSGYSGTGGAMGAAQFMPDTWWGYRDEIADATGHNPPDPWDLVDGVMAMALKLEHDGATEDGKVQITVPRAPNADVYMDYPQCSSYKSSVAQKKAKVKWETYAAMRYLGWSCYGYANYAPAIQNLANGYDKL